MGEEEKGTEGAMSSENGVCKVKGMDIDLAEKKKELNEKVVKEDSTVKGEGNVLNTDEENDSKEEENKEEAMEEDSKDDGKGEGNESKDENNKEEEMGEESKENEKSEPLMTCEANESKEEKSKAHEMEEDSKENEKGDAVRTAEENDSNVEKKKEEEMEEDGNDNGKGEAPRTDEESSLGKENSMEVEHKDVEEPVKKGEECDTVEDKEIKMTEEQAGEDKDEEEKTEASKEEHGLTKSRRGKSAGRKVDERSTKEPITPAVFCLDRPVRERKSVERLVAVIEKETVKVLRIEKGRGTPLKDIPNVAYKLLRKKNEETFKMLHLILFGRRAKAVDLRNNLSRFSGFAWHENEEKHKLKIKEKFDKYVKEKLLDFCDVLDIPVAKATTRKEDVVTKLLDFLVAPHVTTDAILAETEQSSKAVKRKRANTGNSSSFGSPTAKRSARKRKTDYETPKDDKSAHETDDDSVEDDEEKENNVPDAMEDEAAGHSENEDKKEESEEESGKHKHSSLNSSAQKEPSAKAISKKVATPKEATVVSTPQKVPADSSSEHSKTVRSDTSPIVFSRKKKKDMETAKRKSPTTPKSIVKDKVSNEKAGKKMVKGKDKPKENSGPSEEELRKAIYEILKVADLNTATFTHILKQLAQQFDMDLKPSKSTIKLMIQEELTKLADEAEEEEEEENKGKNNEKSKEVQEPAKQALEA